MKLLGGALVVTAAVLVAGCGSGSGGPSIVLYNGQHLELTRAVVAAFEQQTGISVRMRTNDGVVLADQILQEGHSSPADVYLTENSPELMNLEEHGLLAKLSPSILRQVPERDSSPAGDWVGVAFRVRSLVYDPSRLATSKLPRSILDLAEPQWQGKVAIAPLDSDFPPLVGALINTRGVKAATAWLAGLKRNAAIYQNEESVVAAVNRGDVAVGVINSYYWYRLRFEVGVSGMHSALYYFPGGDAGSVVNISGAAVLASSSHYPEAARFVEFLVSRSGQRLISQGDDFEYPARPGVAANSALPRLGHVAHTSLSIAALGDDKQAAQLVANTGFVS